MMIYYIEDSLFKIYNRYLTANIMRDHLVNTNIFSGTSNQILRINPLKFFSYVHISKKNDK